MEEYYLRNQLLHYETPIETSITVSTPPRRNSISEYSETTKSRIPTHRTTNKSLSTYNSPQIHSALPSPRSSPNSIGIQQIQNYHNYQSPLNNSNIRSSYTSMSSYPGAGVQPSYYYRTASGYQSRSNQIRDCTKIENGSKFNNINSMVSTNSAVNPRTPASFVSYDEDLETKDKKLESLVQDLQWALQKRSMEVQKKNAMINQLELELDTKSCQIANLERENEQLKMFIKRKGKSTSNNPATQQSKHPQSALSSSSSSKVPTDNNYYRKLPHPPPASSTSSNSSSQPLSGRPSNFGATKLNVPGHSSHKNSSSNQPTKSRAKRNAISGESAKYLTTNSVSTKRIEKPIKTKELITSAIFTNDYMKHLESSQIAEIVDYMSPISYRQSAWIIQEGEVGSVVYVLEDGLVEVSKNGSHIREMGQGTVFGELAILYNCTRTASVRAKTDCKLWAIDRQCFQSIMMKSGLKKQEEYIRFLRSVPTFQDMSIEVLGKIAGVLGENHYSQGDFIIREGAKGDTFYIIEKGRVKVTKKSPTSDEEIFIRFLDRGSWFGEKALRDEDVRTANIIAESPTGVDCLVLDRDSYNLLIGDIVNFDKQYPDDDRAKRRTMKFQELLLRDLVVITTLGVGGFGRVELVRIGNDDRKTFALKVLKKFHIVETRQQEHVMNERDILMEVDSDFIIKLYKTFKDRRYLYMMMEVCLGGEVWTILREKLSFDDATTRFYTASVILALEYLHRKGIVFRDLKPENCLLDEKGFCKLTDFGFAKKIGFAKKTWTFCGTPEYVAPEIILNKGHDFAVDIWSLGILMYELLIGTPPFTSSDPMKTYNIILKGMQALDFPHKITKQAHSLIKKLCRENPSERLGYGKTGLTEIKKNLWFDGFNWDGLCSRKLKPPIIPEVKSATDVSNFDLYSPDEDTPPEDITGWDKEF